ncbi:sigma-70 family RNA polymerase sigma factor [Leucobacter viscericola]|uniref:Sigma-70 family RNA polymerase sigma factor n=1 Tax=Leucobacter viscericola TaxID=2714935 RepID=A0A6G7XFP2_9MICO|nr:sigma-70 family RNA polymerase sigma factor [Leucobacter viscericola]QIK63286.1 sigma-70 family RNA polymerase sigma factor [Leucobacter viscericola]
MSPHVSVPVSDEEFCELFERFRPMLIGYARRFAHPSVASEDVVSEAFTSVLARIRHGAGPTVESFLSYMRVCIRNEATRANRIAKRELMSGEFTELVDGLIADEEEPATIPDAWDEDAVTRAFGALPQREQQVLWLAEVDGEKMSEIGARLELSPNAAAVVAFRARESLRLNYLLEATAEASSCEQLPRMYLAQSVLNVVPPKRGKRVAGHLDECTKCTSMAQRMRAISLPAATLVVVAAGAEIMREIVWDVAPASAIEGGVGGGSWLTTKTAKVLIAAAGAAVVGAIVIVGLQGSSPKTDGPGEASSGAASSQTTEPAASDDATTTLPGSPKKHPNDTGPRPDGNQPDTASGDSGNTGTDNSGNGGGEDLPPGVRSLDWQNGNQVVLLNVRFDPDTQPDAYSVTVNAPAGETILQASAGCAVTGATAVCVPGQRFVGLEDYNWKFKLSGGANGRPTAEINRL